MRELKRIEELDLSGKRVFLRADLNVTFKPGTTDIADDSRIKASLPTLNLLLQRGAKVLICSHLGRPKGKVVENLRIEPVRKRLQQMLNRPIEYAGGPHGDQPARTLEYMQNAEVAMLENLRFSHGEEANDADFADHLSSLCDIFIDDAFGASHRSHASIVGIARNAPVYAGILIRDEIQMLTRALESDETPAVAIIGGAKAADKVAVLQNLAQRVQTVLIGGGMTKTFQAANRLPFGTSPPSKDEIQAAGSLLDDPEVSTKLRLPTDVVAADRFEEDSPHRNVPVTDIPQNCHILDIGAETTQSYVETISQARKIIWNGPLGVFEWEAFSKGTTAVARAIASRHDKAFSLAGGGSTAEAIHRLGLASSFTHISTGGGASLEFLEGRTLPGIAVLATD